MSSMDRHELFTTRKARAVLRKARKSKPQHKQKSNLIQIDVDALQQMIRDIYELGKRDGLQEGNTMYHADDEINDLHEFMREEADAREKQEEYESDSSDTETLATAKRMHREDY